MSSEGHCCIKVLNNHSTILVIQDNNLKLGSGMMVKGLIWVLTGTTNWNGELFTIFDQIELCLPDGFSTTG